MQDYSNQTGKFAGRIEELTQAFIEIISETNGITLDDTLELMMNTDRIRKDATLVGDIQTAGIVIEDGAYFKGGIDITRANRENG